MTSQHSYCDTEGNRSSMGLMSKVLARDYIKEGSIQHSYYTVRLPGVLHVEIRTCSTSPERIRSGSSSYPAWEMSMYRRTTRLLSCVSSPSRAVTHIYWKSSVIRIETSITKWRSGSSAK